MDNKLLGVIIIGFGLLVLFSEQEYSWVISAIAVGIGSGFLIRKNEKNDIDNKRCLRKFLSFMAITT